MAQFVDRRLNPRDKSLGNRQRFLRRTRAEVKRAVDKAVAERTIADAGKGGAVSIPTDGIGEPQFHLSRDLGERDTCCPATRSSSPGTASTSPKAEAGADRGARARTPAAARTRSPSRSPRPNSSTSCSRTSSFPTSSRPRSRTRPRASSAAPATPATARRRTSPFCARCGSAWAGGSRFVARASPRSSGSKRSSRRCAPSR